MNTANEFMVSSLGGGKIGILNQAAMRPLSVEDALLLAAWLVVMAQTSELLIPQVRGQASRPLEKVMDRFDRIVSAIEGC